MSENENPISKQSMILPPPDMVYIPDLDVNLVTPNPKNPMVMSEKTAQLLVENIEKGGFITAITVWKPPEGELYQIIDGEHRWRAQRNLGHKTIPALYARHIKTQTQADYFLLMLNRIKGHFEQDKLGQLIYDLDKNLERLSDLTGYDADLIDALTRLVSVEKIPQEKIEISKELEGIPNVFDKEEVDLKQPIYESKPTSLFMVNLPTADFLELNRVIEKIREKEENKDLASIIMKVFKNYGDKL